MTALIAINAASLSAEVKVYSEDLDIPTYQIGSPEIMPYFTKIYPYTMYDKLTENKVDKTYNALWVENDYVKALVLPEIGGRLHGAQDKTNGYWFLYDQRVIKPGLVGMAGAWISGGIEYNFPHGHRPSGFRDTDWIIEKNDDGSVTAWTGEVELVYGMRWSVGHTVYPGRNWVITKHRLFNCTPYMHSFQYWATSAVRATKNYQAVIPGEVMTGHGKHEYFRWPVGKDGVDKTYWKNLPGATSFFAVNTPESFFGGYSPERQAGMVHVADRQLVPGKKLWTWGTAPSGRIWEEILTDGDLPYYEPQAGAYSDNQPDYLWIRPGETKVFENYWFPVRDIGVWDYANIEGTLNLELDGGKVKFGWSPTGANTAAVVAVSYKGKNIFEQTVDADPGKPFVGEVDAPSGVEIYDLHLAVVSSAGNTLVEFSHPRPTNPPFPEEFHGYPMPDKVKAIDELYTYGDYYEKFCELDRALMYYNEVLERDSGDVRTNAAMGLLALKDGKYDLAREYFEKALKRDTANFKSMYYLGLIELAEGNLDKAEDRLNRSTYDLAYYGAGQFELAQLKVMQGDLVKALEHVNRSLNGNGDNAEAHSEKALILNRLGRYEEALEVLDNIRSLDPLDMLSASEKIVSLKALGRTSDADEAQKTLMNITRRDSQNHIELAIRYARNGLYKDAIGVLELLMNGPSSERGNISPMVYYYAAYYSHMLGNEKDAEAQLRLAAKANMKYTFPSRLETLKVLGYATMVNPDDAHAHSLLGDLYFAKGRQDEALTNWSKAAELEPDNAVTQRNLGMVLNKLGKLEASKAAYEKAVESSKESALALQELNEVLKKLGWTQEKRIKYLEKHKDLASQRDALLTQMISLYVQTGRYDEALKWLSEHHFHSWEGRYGIHQYWVESHIRKGEEEMKAGKYEKALEHFRLSKTYPFNLEVAPQPKTVFARSLYNIGLALEKLGKNQEAQEMFAGVVAERDTMKTDSAYRFYLGKAYERLGRESEARAVYQALLDEVKRQEKEGDVHLSGTELYYDPSRNAEALNEYKTYLALEGLGRTAEAKEYRAKAVKLDPIIELRAFSPPRAGW